MEVKLSSSRHPLFLARTTTELNSGHPFGSEPESECSTKELPLQTFLSLAEVFVDPFHTSAREGDWFIIAAEKNKANKYKMKYLRYILPAFYVFSVWSCPSMCVGVSEKFSASKSIQKEGLF